jgi:hypothetical protein
MKSFHLLLLFFLLPATFPQIIPILPDPRDDLKRPSSLQAIKRIYFPANILPQNTSQIEDDPTSYQLSSPLDGSQEDLFNPRLIKNNSPESYNFNPVNLSVPLTEFKPDPRTKGIVLVKNISALRLLPGYNGLFDEEDGSTAPRRLPKYSKDPLPYYSPIHNGSQIITEKEKENLFSVPIDDADEKNLFDPDNEGLHEIRKARLARSTPSTYYDPTYWPFYRRPDGINKTLLEAAYQKTKPKAVRLQDYTRHLNDEEREKRMILGKWNFTDQFLMDKTKNWELTKENNNELFQDWYNNTVGWNPSYQIKKNDPNPYTPMKFKETTRKLKNGKSDKSVNRLRKHKTRKHLKQHKI